MSSIARPYGNMDPNSSHQLWSKWEFRIFGGRIIPTNALEDNVRRWLRKGFGSVGRGQITRKVIGPSIVTVITVEVEGKPAHDPQYVARVREQFVRFVADGLGPMAVASTKVHILAGDVQDGKPRAQLVVMPTLRIDNE